MEFGELAVLHLTHLFAVQFTLDLRIKPLEQEYGLLSLQNGLNVAVGHRTRVVADRLVTLLLRSCLLNIRHLTWLYHILEHEDAATLQFLILDDAAREEHVQA